MDTVEQLTKKAVNLIPQDRVKLIEAIYSSLENPDPAIETAWINESDAWYEAYKRGEIEAVDWDEISKRYET